MSEKKTRYLAGGLVLDPAYSANWFAARIQPSAPGSIGDQLIALIGSGEIPPGTRLPTVRELSQALRVSSGTIAQVWAKLRTQGLIATHQRGGTVIVGASHSRLAGPASPGSMGRQIIDLASGHIDPRLCPGMGKALVAAHQFENHYHSPRELITRQLREACEVDWPFVAQSMIAVGGGGESTLLALEVTAPKGSLIAVEEPTSPRILESIRRIGLIPIPIACDREGPMVGELEKALKRQPAAFVYQPRAQIPLGHVVSAERLSQLADVISQAEHLPWVVEDDQIGPIAAASAGSLGGRLNEKVIHVRAYCKSYGVELRTSVIGGPSQIISRIPELRSRGAAATSRILQNTLAHLIIDPESRRDLIRSRAHYSRIRQTFIDALSRRGLPSGNLDGLTVWIEVPDESAALLNLTTYGISAGAGRKCFVDSAGGGHLRFAVTGLPDDVAAIERTAELIRESIFGNTRNEFD